MKNLKALENVTSGLGDVPSFTIKPEYNRGEWEVKQTGYGFDLLGFGGENQVTVRWTSGQDKGWAVVILELAVDNSNVLPIHHFDHTMDGYEKTWNVFEEVVIPELDRIMEKAK